MLNYSLQDRRRKVQESAVLFDFCYWPDLPSRRSLRHKRSIPVMLCSRFFSLALRGLRYSGFWHVSKHLEMEYYESSRDFDGLELIEGARHALGEY